jgi:hypothetical protein
MIIISNFLPDKCRFFVVFYATNYAILANFSTLKINPSKDISGLSQICTKYKKYYYYRERDTGGALLRVYA